MRHKNLYVCPYCFAKLEAQKGKQSAFLNTYLDNEFDEPDEDSTKCDLCNQTGFDRLYELM